MGGGCCFGMGWGTANNYKRGGLLLRSCSRGGGGGRT